MLVLSSMQPDVARRKKGRSKPDRILRKAPRHVTNEWGRIPSGLLGWAGKVAAGTSQSKEGHPQPQHIRGRDDTDETIAIQNRQVVKNVFGEMLADLFDTRSPVH